MKDIVLNKTKIQCVEKRDKLFAEALTNSLKNFKFFLRQIPSFWTTINNVMRDGDVYIAKIPKQIIKKIESGELEMLKRKDNGLFTGMIRRKDGNKIIVKQTEWEKINLNQDIISNLNQIAIQASIAELTEMLFEIDKKIDLLIWGQQTDRISKVISGIDIYEQAYLVKNNNLFQKIQLSNALQSLNEGRTSLMLDLKKTLALKLRDKKISDMFWSFFLNINKREVEQFALINKEYEKIKESIKYINLGSLYIFRIYTLLCQTDSACQSQKQYDEFCNCMINEFSEKEKYFPYEKKAVFSLPDIKNHFKVAKNNLPMLEDENNSIIIEMKREEIIK